MFLWLTPKVLPLDNKNENFPFFILYCAHLFVPLAYAESTSTRK